MAVVEDFVSERLVYRRSRTIRANITIKHWQLKNLLCTSSAAHRPEQLLYVCRHSVRTLDFAAATIGLAGPKCSFEPRSLTSRYGWIVAGAEHGVLAIMDDRAEPETSPLQVGPRKQEVAIGGCLVNGLHIYKNPGDEPVVLVSSNDHSLKCYNLATGRLDVPIEMPTAMNHASVSPDGKYMVGVGDNTECYLFVQESGSWRRQSSFQVAADACFATGFSASGRMLAVGSQDGTCSLFDVRMLQAGHRPERHRTSTSVRLAMGTSSQPGDPCLFRCWTKGSFPHGSIRSLAFSPSPLDLLVFSESTTHARLLDTRDFSQPVQTLSVPLAESARDRHHGDGHYGLDGRDRELSGVCWSRSGNQLFVGSEETVTGWTVNATERRCFPSATLR